VAIEAAAGSIGVFVLEGVASGQVQAASGVEAVLCQDKEMSVDLPITQTTSETHLCRPPECRVDVSLAGLLLLATL
jgi:hypothetical protein